MAKDQGGEVAIVEKKIAPVMKEVGTLTIEGAEDMKVAVSLLSKLNIWKDTVVEDREKLTKPLNAALKEIRERYKPVDTMLEEAIDVLRKKMTTYQTQANREAEEKKDKIAERVGDGKGKLKVETAVRQMGEIETPQTNIGTDIGIVKFQTLKRFKVMDITMLPVEYILADEVKIRKAMKEGVELAGVHYYEEQVPVNLR